MTKYSVASFLAKCTGSSFWENHSVIWMVGQTYPGVFIDQLLCYLDMRASMIVPVSRCIASYHTIAEIMGSIGQTFLGQRRIICLGDVGAKNDAAFKQLRDYLASYQGPHTIICFSSEQLCMALEKKSIGLQVGIVSVDDVFDAKLYIQTMRLFSYGRAMQQPALVKQLLMLVPRLSLEQVCVMGRHGMLMGSVGPEAYIAHMQRLVAPDYSLRELMQAFFNKKGSSFYRLWAKLESLYTPIFWLVFFSNQLWQAHGCLTYTARKEFAAAKRIGYRLPGAGRGLRLTLQELEQAHIFLMRAEYLLKNGSDGNVFDLFFLRFFSDGFAI